MSEKHFIKTIEAPGEQVYLHLGDLLIYLLSHEGSEIVKKDLVEKLKELRK